MPKDIVLVHGFRGAPAGLKEIANFLEKSGMRVFVPAVPPFAGASGFPENMSECDYAAFYAEFLASYVKKHHLERPILVGHSMGTLVVSAAASAYPKLFDRNLVLLSPISVRPAKFFATISPLSAYLPCGMVNVLTTALMCTDWSQISHTLALTKSCTDTHTCSKLDERRAAEFSANSEISDFDLSSFNVHIIAGAKDRLIPMKATSALAEKLNTKPTFINDSGHLHNYEKAELTAKLILEKIGGLARPHRDRSRQN